MKKNDCIALKVLLNYLKERGIEIKTTVEKK